MVSKHRSRKRLAMRCARTAIILAVLTWTAGSQALATPSTRGARAQGNRCYAVRIEAISSPSNETSTDRGRRRRYRRRFSAHEVLDLSLSVWLPAKNDASVIEIRLYTPTGRLYEVLQARADASTTPSKIGTRYRGRRARVVSARLPVAGSHITGRSLYGKWRAEVFLDGNEKSCTRRPKNFSLDP